MTDLDWMRHAECLGMVDGMWDESTPSPDALRVCFRCPVQKECAQYGLSRVDASDAGVLGGLGLYDRERIRAGRSTLDGELGKRLEQLRDHDRQQALDEDFARTMPRMELV